MVGTLLLALTLAAYALAMTMGRGSFGPLNAALLLAAAFGAGLFVLTEARVASPLIQLSRFRDPVLSASLITSALVSTVLMATLVVGPFYLSRALALDAAAVGLVLSVGPLVVALTGVPAGRIADRFGIQRMTLIGLVAIAAGCFLLALLPTTLGIPGLRRASHRDRRRLRAVPDGQQHRRHGGCRSGPARRDFGHAQPVAQSRADHRRIRHGRGVRARIGGERRDGGESASRRRRHAHHICGRGRSDRRRSRARCREPRAGKRARAASRCPERSAT